MGPAIIAQEPGPVGPGPVIIHRQPPFEHAFRAEGAMGRWWDNPRLAAQLKLTPDQQKTMDAILYDHREKLIDLQANLEKAELAMQPLLSADQPNETAIDAQIDKVVTARADLERANARFLLALRMKLTPDQWKQVQSFRAAHMEGREERHRVPGPARQWRDRPSEPGNPPPPPTPTENPPAPAPGANQ
jgi:periplasmic protein CpxP/Spy